MNGNKLTGIGMLVLGMYISWWPVVGVLTSIHEVATSVADALQLAPLTILPSLAIGITLTIIGAKLTRIPDPCSPVANKGIDLPDERL
ncbi:MAG: hypothetical protein EB830_06880 [Nitrosopumilus sp. H13]|nr:MAG: hypothetical protein EB830_06880 [Nitrosopumilus sp. H13]